ncbi:hypothetical protein lerEdw1_009684 [Lerista edwardsae]|nr:hypothetical protein lerEdw1_009684 [Lerista edwardsae]
MSLPSRCRGPLKAIMLAGIILNCIVQPVQAQNRLLLTKEPQDPQVGQEVTLIPHGALNQITLCQWLRESPEGPSGEILSYTQFDTNLQNSNGSAYTGRETLHRNCSLRIRRLTPQDTGNYTVVIETVAQKPGGVDQGDVTALEAFIYLQIKVPVQQINIAVDKLTPKPGESITLTPQVPIRQFTFCQWSIQTSPGYFKPILRQSPGEQVQQVDSEYRDRVTVGEACSLQIRQLRVTDSKNYTVTIRAHSQQQRPQQPQQPQQPGPRDHGRGEPDLEYTGHVNVIIAEKRTETKGSSASLSYSAGLIAGALLGSLAWADALGSLFCGLLDAQRFPNGSEVLIISQGVNQYKKRVLWSMQEARLCGEECVKDSDEFMSTLEGVSLTQ